MGDFLLDFRPKGERRVNQLAPKFRFLPHIDVQILNNSHFDLCLAFPEQSEIWAPFAHPDGTRLIALAGRVALDDPDWNAALTVPGDGGIVCKGLDSMYQKRGLAGLEDLSGNFTLLVYDQRAGLFHLLTDSTGVFPAFELVEKNFLLFGSHPDILAEAADEHGRLDETSLAEFALTGSVSPPFSYYRRIRGIGRATALTLALPLLVARPVSRRCYLPLEFNSRPDDREEDVAGELARAFQNAVARRSITAHGRCAVALSGGLDSRAVLASVDSPSTTFAFTCYDRENQENRTAARIAQSVGVQFFSRQRPFEYYADNAEMGMRVSGGMGSIANNHFLGVLPWLREQGAKTLLTGCYCDYLFKALPLNRQTHPLTGREQLAPYKREFYFAHFWPKTALANEVRARIDSRFPNEIAESTSDAAVFELEHRRTFPLCYEADNAQRLVPQRLANWFVPISDPSLIKLYCRIPYRWKLNRSIFRKAVARICRGDLSAVPDANTGAAVQASHLREALSRSLIRVRGRLRRLRPAIAGDGSWPNWHYYLAHSRRMASLWSAPSSAADELFPRLLGRRVSADLHSYQGNDIWLLIQLLSLKLWLEQRTC